MRADFVVVGAGVAGSVLARMLKDRGARVLLVDGGLGASHAPAAVVNPIRAKRGKAVPEAKAKLALARGFYGRFFPLNPGLTLVPPEGKKTRFLEAAREAGLKVREASGAIFLPEAFWLRPRPLLFAMTADIPRIRARAVHLEQGRVFLADGRALQGEVFFAGGAEGAGLGEVAGSLAAGSLLLIAEKTPATVAGVFLAGSAVGGTYRPLARYEAWTPTRGELEELSAKAAAVLGPRPTPVGAYAGVRLRAPARFFPRAYGHYFGGFGSTGFLEAPYEVARFLGR